MGRERYVVRLEGEERDLLERLIRGGRSPARKVARARILLKADAGWGIERIVAQSEKTIGIASSQATLYLFTQVT